MKGGIIVNDKIMNIIELCNYLHCSESHVRNLVARREIPYFRLGYKICFKLSSINKWIDEYNKNENN